jgi:hypothetical protein
MTKTPRSSKPKRRARATLPPVRRSVTRREYAAVVVRLGTLEIQVQRNRGTIELQAQRIGHLQEQIEVLKAAAAQQTLATEIAALPLSPTTPTVES